MTVVLPSMDLHTSRQGQRDRQLVLQWDHRLRTGIRSQQLPLEVIRSGIP
jgi:hypothetical protein